MTGEAKFFFQEQKNYITSYYISRHMMDAFHFYMKENYGPHLLKS